MKLQQQINFEPEGTVVVGQTVKVKLKADNSTVATLASDNDGYVTYEASGHPGPFYLTIEGVPGGDKFWRSDDVRAAGALPVAEIPHALRAFGDGVIADYEDALVVSSGAGSSLSIASGAAMAAGHPFVVYDPGSLSYVRPVSSTRVDRVIIRLNPTGSGTTPGKALLVLLAGVEGGSAPTLTQTATTYEISLASVSIPVVAPITITDERTYTNNQLDDADIDRVTAASTTNASGEAITGLDITLSLDRAVTYDIEASISAQQVSVTSITDWVLQNTYGPTFNGLALSAPGQVAVDSTGRILIADTGNNRLVILTSAGAYSTGITGLTGITGVCVDSSDYLYVVFGSGSLYTLTKYNSALVSQWTTGSVLGTYVHAATDGTNVYVTDTFNAFVRKYLCSSGAPGSPSSLGTSGSGNGQFGAGGPYGIVYVPGNAVLYIGDPGNSRVQRWSPGPAYVGSVAGFSTPRGLSFLSTVSVGSQVDFVVAEYGTDRVRKVTGGTSAPTISTLFAQTAPVGIAVATGDVVWVTNSSGGTIAKWDEATTPGGYGQIAIEIDSSVSAYTGIGAVVGSVQNSAVGSKAGVGTVLIRGFAKATSATMTMQGLVLSARAYPRG